MPPGGVISHGKGPSRGRGSGRKDTRVCMTESLCYSLGTAALLIGCTPIQSALVLKKRPHVSSEWKDPSGWRSQEEKGLGAACATEVGTEVLVPTCRSAHSRGSVETPERPQ